MSEDNNNFIYLFLIIVLACFNMEKSSMIKKLKKKNQTLSESKKTFVFNPNKKLEIICDKCRPQKKLY